MPRLPRPATRPVAAEQDVYPQLSGAERSGSSSRTGRWGRGLVVRAAVVSTLLIGLGSLFGVVRDLLITSLFGANGSTDAFLVAWTVADTVSVLVEGLTAFLLIPAFTRALAVADNRNPDHLFTDPRRALDEVVAAVLPHLTVVLVGVATVVALAAPWLVQVLAPGLADPDLGVQAMRIIAPSLVLLGLAWFFIAALHAHLVFGPPAAMSLILNLGIIASMLLWHDRIGVLAAAVGGTAGAAVLLAVQLPSYRRRVALPRRVVLRSSLLSFGVLAPVAVYMLSRQAQVYIERFIGSWLPPGTISHLNYAQKIGQLPSSLALMLAVITFPILARNVASGATSEAQRRTEIDVRVIGAVVVFATAFLFVFGRQVVELLFQRGEFTAADTAATADILRIYVLGLLGQALVEIIARTFFVGRVSFAPAGFVGIGLVVTTVVAALAAPVWGAPGIAAGNAAGICVTALLLLVGRRAHNPAVAPKAVGLILARLGPPALAAFGAGLAVDRLSRSSAAAPVAVLGGSVMLMIFAVVAMASGAIPVPRRRS